VSALLEIRATTQGCPYGWHLSKGILRTADCESKNEGNAVTGAVTRTCGNTNTGTQVQAIQGLY